MKHKNPLRKLTLLKKNIAHLNNEQMHAAHGGEVYRKVFCSDTSIESRLIAQKKKKNQSIISPSGAMRRI